MLTCVDQGFERFFFFFSLKDIVIFITFKNVFN